MDLQVHQVHQELAVLQVPQDQQVHQELAEHRDQRVLLE